jgi:hypothetical protein
MRELDIRDKTLLRVINCFRVNGEQRNWIFTKTVGFERRRPKMPQLHRSKNLGLLSANKPRSAETTRPELLETRPEASPLIQKRAVENELSKTGGLGRSLSHGQAFRLKTILAPNLN